MDLRLRGDDRFVLFPRERSLLLCHSREGGNPFLKNPIH